jgi:hypothetical protein
MLQVSVPTIHNYFAAERKRMKSQTGTDPR